MNNLLYANLSKTGLIAAKSFENSSKQINQAVDKTVQSVQTKLSNLTTPTFDLKLGVERFAMSESKLKEIKNQANDLEKYFKQLDQERIKAEQAKESTRIAMEQQSSELMSKVARKNHEEAVKRYNNITQIQSDVAKKWGELSSLIAQAPAKLADQGKKLKMDVSTQFFGNREEFDKSVRQMSDIVDIMNQSLKRVGKEGPQAVLELMGPFNALKRYYRKWSFG